MISSFDIKKKTKTNHKKQREFNKEKRIIFIINGLIWGFPVRVTTDDQIFDYYIKH